MTLIEEFSTIVGGFAAIGLLLWAMIGNPNILGPLRSRLGKLSTSTEYPAKRRVVNIAWGQLEAAASAFAKGNTVHYDLVVGVQPDGVDLANLFAGRLNIRYAGMYKHYTGTRRTSFLVFEPDKHSRSVRSSVTQFTPPEDVVNPSRVLVVDGVTTFGNGLLKAEVEISKKYSDASVDFYVYAVDKPRLAASHPEMVDRVKFHRTIDNFAEWLHFPWDSA